MQYKVGDYVRIFTKPKLWSSQYSDDCPLEDLEYPFEGEIYNLDKKHAKIGAYGWDWKGLIKNGNIELIKKPNTSKPEDYKYLVKLLKKLKII